MYNYKKPSQELLNLIDKKTKEKEEQEKSRIEQEKIKDNLFKKTMFDQAMEAIKNCIDQAWFEFIDKKHIVKQISELDQTFRKTIHVPFCIKGFAPVFIRLEYYDGGFYPTVKSGYDNYVIWQKENNQPLFSTPVRVEIDDNGIDYYDQEMPYLATYWYQQNWDESWHQTIIDALVFAKELHDVFILKQKRCDLLNEQWLAKQQADPVTNEFNSLFFKATLKTLEDESRPSLTLRETDTRQEINIDTSQMIDLIHWFQAQPDYDQFLQTWESA